MNTRNGFTLMELLVTLAIIIVLSTILGASFIGARANSRLKQQSAIIVSILRDAQQRSITHQDNVEWGVYFEGSKILLKKEIGIAGESQTVSASTFIEGIELNSAESTLVSVSFAKITGVPNASGVIKIRKVGSEGSSDPKDSRTITVTANGLIDD